MAIYQDVLLAAIEVEMIFGEEEEVVGEEEVLLKVVRRNLRDILNPFELPESSFKDIFRFSKATAQYVIEELLPHMRQTERCTAVPPFLRVLSSINFYASGSYQRRVGNDLTAAMSQTSISTSLTAVSAAINEVLLPQWVKFPIEQHERDVIKARFFQDKNFPGVIGCVDGTQIAIVPPIAAQNPQMYVNRKAYHSKNVQIVCDSRLRILAINARHPGSRHDQFIWRFSAVRGEILRRYNAGEPRNEWLLGDSGYTEEPWLLLPMNNQPEGSPGHRYTQAQCSTRNCVERCIGVLKGRWRCLRKDRVLHYSPLKAGLIINACAVLHNIALHRNEPLPLLFHDDIDNMPAVPPLVNAAAAHGQDNVNLYREGLAMRDQLIRNRYQ